MVNNFSSLKIKTMIIISRMLSQRTKIKKKIIIMIKKRNKKIVIKGIKKSVIEKRIKNVQ